MRTDQEPWPHFFPASSDEAKIEPKRPIWAEFAEFCLFLMSPLWILGKWARDCAFLGRTLLFGAKLCGVDTWTRVKNPGFDPKKGGFDPPGF